MYHLHTAATPNGHKVSIMLEELGVPYTVHAVNLSDLEQKTPEFLAMNPNGRIPVLVDGASDDLVVFESGAILVYLAEKHGSLLPADVRGRTEVMQWLMFQMGGVGPMQGQAHVFVRYAPEKIPFAIDRYQREVRRLYEVLDTRLAGRDFLAEDYSIADIATWPWVSQHAWAEVDISDLANLGGWLERVGSRPAVQRGSAVPEVMDAQDAGDDKLDTGRNMLV